MWENLNNETATRTEAADEEARRVRAAAEEASRVLRSEAEERAAKIIGEAEEAARKRRARVDENAQETLATAESQAAKIVADAEARASRMVDLATLKADELEKSANGRALERSTEVLNNAQDRLDVILAAERRVHERLLLALNELQGAVDLVGGESSPLLARTDQPARATPANAADTVGPLTLGDEPLDAEDRSMLSRLVGEGVGSALRPSARG